MSFHPPSLILIVSFHIQTQAQDLLTLLPKFCWGGKVISLTSKSGNTPWKAAAIAHPAMLDPSDATGISIPFAVLASKDEVAADVQKFSENLEGPKVVRTFDKQIHGFMAARGNLEDSSVLEDYQQGYQMILEFLGNYL